MQLRRERAGAHDAKELKCASTNSAEESQCPTQGREKNASRERARRFSARMLTRTGRVDRVKEVCGSRMRGERERKHSCITSGKAVVAVSVAALHRTTQCTFMRMHAT
eukprot:6196592-Pleurochrysis_carterae.AAC.1